MVKKNKRDLPWRRTRDPYAIWVSEIMLQQTQVTTVIPYYENFLKSFPTPRHLAKANLSKVLKVWEGLGYYSRARNIHRASQIVLNQFHGKIPDTLNDLLNCLESVDPQQALSSPSPLTKRHLSGWECEEGSLQEEDLFVFL